jgi:uncharacterized protein YjbI with pentapeptide repeats
MSEQPAEHDVGATLGPDFVASELQSAAITHIEPRFVLEDLRVRGASLISADAGSGRISRAHLEDVDLDESRLRGIEMADVLAERLTAANANWGGARLRRSLFSDARLTGLSLAEAQVKDVRFKACKLDYANFRNSEITRVSFEDCVLDGADFQGAAVKATAFSGCQLNQVDFTKAEMSRVDLRGSELVPAGSASGLRGSIITPVQLVGLARSLAHALGITVEELD